MLPTVSVTGGLPYESLPPQEMYNLFYELNTTSYLPVEWSIQLQYTLS